MELARGVLSDCPHGQPGKGGVHRSPPIYPIVFDDMVPHCSRKTNHVVGTFLRGNLPAKAIRFPRRKVLAQPIMWWEPSRGNLPVGTFPQKRSGSWRDWEPSRKSNPPLKRAWWRFPWARLIWKSMLFAVCFPKLFCCLANTFSCPLFPTVFVDIVQRCLFCLVLCYVLVAICWCFVSESLP